MSTDWRTDVADEARHVLETSYGIRPLSVERLTRDSPNQIWRCSTADGTYTLKRLGRPGQDRWLAFQDAAIVRAAQHGVPAESLVRAVGGSSTAAADGALWQVRRYVPGRHFRDGDPADLRAAAETVAAVHAVPVAGLPRAGANPIQDMEFWLGADEPAVDELGELVSSVASPEMWDEVHGAYRTAYRRARADLDLPAYQSLPVALTHGEIAGSNLVFDDEDRLVSLLDWDGVDIRPRVYDLARAVLFLARTGRGSFRVHRDLAVDLVLRATAANPPSPEELRAIVPVLELYCVPTLPYVRQMAKTGPATLTWYLRWTAEGARTVRDNVLPVVTRLAAHLDRTGAVREDRS
ncbi:aminoglycoside phosphotransferase family protein [Streptomyces europaeiscabiei]|uniref:phosphotransferase enzyme family protein n=1 Tax=Streptomyces europaeiscabiei TaxID=146819 RepID=UPI002E14C376|nr:aminoglycoside phosphotransferase family protein [Streptomyces europaeiscabiei]